MDGDPVIVALLAEIEDDAALSALLGVDLSPPSAPAPSVVAYGPLEEWLRRSEETHRFLQQVRRAERGAG